MPTYNPMIKRGTFNVNGTNIKAGDVAEAKYKYLKRHGVAAADVTAAQLQSLAVKIVTPVLRQY
jgi:hypothetical protein